MNRKQLLVLLIIGLALGGAGIYLAQKKSQSFERTEKTAEGRLLGDFPVNDVAHVTLRQNTNQVNLVKQDVWVVQERHNYPANFNQIRDLLQKLVDLRAAQSQRVGESQHARLDLVDSEDAGTNAATVVELKGRDGKLVRSLRLGKESTRGGSDPMGMGGGFPNGRWIYVPEKPGEAHLVSETFYNVNTTPENWLNKDFVRVEKLKSVEVQFPVETNSWKLTRESESGEWKLAEPKEGEQLDTTKVSSVSYAFSSPSFNDVLPGNIVASEDGTNAPTVIKLETFDQFAYTIHAGAQTNGAYPIHVAVTATLPQQREAGADENAEDKERLDKEFKDQQEKLREKLKREQAYEKWTYLVPTWTLDSLLKPRSEFLKAPEPEADEPATASDSETSTNEISALPELELPGAGTSE